MLEGDSLLGIQLDAGGPAIAQVSRVTSSMWAKTSVLVAGSSGR
jgi:hypothetical protein